MVFYIPISERLKCGKNDEFLRTISARKEVRPDWRSLVRDFLKISRTNRWGLTAPSFRTLIAAKDILFPVLFPARCRGD